MSRISVIDRLYAQKLNAMDFNFDNLMARPLLSLLTVQDIFELRRIATSLKLSSKPKVKYAMIDNILLPRGFKKIASGTNRVAYKYLEDQSIVLKVAIDKVGMSDNPNEFYNQFLLKPFVTKVFETSPCGTVGLFERVVPITTIEEYITIAEDVFKLITTQIVGKYVLDDIGTNYFQNIGVRPGFGPVLLDFPYVYELDGNKLFCNVKDPITKIPCGGVIDYDSGFNKLICTKCGKQYFAYQLADLTEKNKIQVRKEGGEKMSITIRKGKEVTRRLDPERTSDVLPNAHRPVKSNDDKPIKKNGISIHRRNTKKEEPKTVTTKTVVLTDSVGVSDQATVTTKADDKCNENISVEDYKTDIPKSLKQEDDKSFIVSGVDMINDYDKQDQEVEPAKPVENDSEKELSEAY